MSGKRIKEFGNTTAKLKQKEAAEVASGKEGTLAKETVAEDIQAIAGKFKDEDLTMANPKHAVKEPRQHIRDVIDTLQETLKQPKFAKNPQLDPNHGLVVSQRIIENAIARLKTIDEYLG